MAAGRFAKATSSVPTKLACQPVAAAICKPAEGSRLPAMATTIAAASAAAARAQNLNRGGARGSSARVLKKGLLKRPRKDWSQKSRRPRLRFAQNEVCIFEPKSPAAHNRGTFFEPEVDIAVQQEQQSKQQALKHRLEMCISVLTHRGGFTKSLHLDFSIS